MHNTMHSFRPALWPMLALAATLAPAAWAAPFTNHGDGTVTDQATGLMWDQCPWGQSGSGCATGTASTHTWAQALGVARTANNATYKGHGDWRLPNKNELESLVQIEKAAGPAIDTVAFPLTPATYFWSSTSYTIVPSPINAWGVNFSTTGFDGGVSAYAKTYADRVRLVRGGASFSAFDALADTTPPILTGPTVTPGSDGITATAAVTVDEDATGYWLVLPATTAAPDAATLKATGTQVALTANTPKTIAITGLSKGTEYKLYFTAKDTAGNLQTTVAASAAFTTPADCGSAHNPNTTPLLASAPAANLCDPASTPAVSGGTSTWTWTCPGNAAPQCQAPRGYTVSTSTGGSGTVSAAQTVVAYNGTTTLTVTPATAYEVDTVTGCGVSLAGGIYTTGQIQTDCTVSATFKHVPVNGQCGSAHGGVFTSAPSTHLCNPGAAPSVTGTGPWSWVCSGQHGGSNANCAASLQGWAVTASASPAQGGTAACSPASVAHDGTATCTATASTGYQFTGWAGACAGQTTASCTLSNVTAAKDSTAQFTQSQYAVTASASPMQGGTATCNPASVAHGGSAICTATASTGYQFRAWTGACAGQGAACTLANVTAAQHSVAQFTQNTLPVPEGPQAGQPLAVAAQPANSWQLAQASTQTVASLNAPALPAGVTLPQGVVRLRLELGTQGSEATVVLTYPQNLPAGTVYYKFGKTQDNQQPHWYPFPGAQVSGNTITLTLKDGGAGDDDLLQNSVIDDPGGPALLAASSPASIPTLGEWALALLAAALGLFSLGALRRRG